MGTEKANMYFTSLSVFASLLIGNSYGTFQIAHIKPSELHDAIVVSANNVVIINNQHKRWPEFQQALKDAEKLYEERYEIWKRLNEMANNASKK